MISDLDRLAGMVGIEREYLTLAGTVEHVPEPALRATLQAMGVAARDDSEVAAALQNTTPLVLGAMQAVEGACFVPDWLKSGRAWGVACQLYGLRSGRNWGIGDFEDLGRFAEIAAAAGADFVGVNPLHALFLAAPERCSPFFPSSRQFLNPLYIAIDQAPGHETLADALVAPDNVRSTELVDYPRVAELKLKALVRLFRIFQTRGEDDPEAADFELFVMARGERLYLHALFETLSETMVREGHGAMWPGWPEEFRHPANGAVTAFAETERERIAFHCWLQWLADRQLGEAQARARNAGMRIGLYLDLAVGVAPDGSATWSDRELTVAGARIGAPPDYYNAAGQDWGIAPLSPAALAARLFEPFRDAIDAVLSHAGALRIDHAMSLYRLFWIADGFGARQGAYVRYPFAEMLSALAEISQTRRAIVIGEDLGVVPPGFRDVMRQMEIQSYRVFFFEKHDDLFLPPSAYPREALACVTTHDLHTLAGWWRGRDIDVRGGIGMASAGSVEVEHGQRAHERRRVLGLLSDNGLLPAELHPVMRGEAEAPTDLPEAVAVALHRLMARTPSRLFVAAAEDLTASAEQVNVPGTMSEYPNWRRKLSVHLEDLPDTKLFRAITAALREERPTE